MTSLAVNCPIACDHCVLSVELQVRHFGLIFGPPDASADRGIRCQDSPHPLDSAVIFSCLFSRRIAFPTCRLVLPAREGASDHCDLRITTPSSFEYHHLPQCCPRSLHHRGLAIVGTLTCLGGSGLFLGFARDFTRRTGADHSGRGLPP